RMGPTCGSTCAGGHGCQDGSQPSRLSCVFVPLTRFRSQIPPGATGGAGDEGSGPGVGLGAADCEEREEGAGVADGVAAASASRVTSSACGAGAKRTLDSSAR